MTTIKVKKLEEFYKSEWNRVSKNFVKKKHSGFVNKTEFANWFVSQLKEFNCQCFYCDTSIHDIRKLIDKKLLTERKTGRGWRGGVLEIDKNSGSYSKENCVVACYYCNNDKSYTTTKEDYKKYFGPNRNVYFKTLLNNSKY
jgi:5-methylcytosine-specific restriction endonuclease McrA